MRINLANYSEGDTIGTLYVTYYVCFKSRTIFPTNVTSNAEIKEDQSMTRSQIIDVINSNLKIS